MKAHQKDHITMIKRSIYRSIIRGSYQS